MIIGWTQHVAALPPIEFPITYPEGNSKNITLHQLVSYLSQFKFTRLSKPDLEVDFIYKL